MYYEYWQLQKPPFDNVPDPGMYVDCHVSLESAIADTLFAIEEGNECLSVIVGDVGLGKTLSLRLIIDSLDKDKYRIALVTNPGISFLQLLQEIIGQLTGSQCEQKKKTDLLELFNKILFETADEGKKVLIFIDEANAISPANLESLRLLTNMQDDQKNLFTIILAGQIELAKRLENPKRANLFQRIGTFSRIEKIPSEEMVAIYLETRLKLAGGTSRIFTNDAAALIWEYSEHGIPRLINKIAKLCLKAGETNGFRQIDGDTVRQIGERFRNLTGHAVPKRKPRMRAGLSITQEDREELYIEPRPMMKEVEVQPCEEPLPALSTPVICLLPGRPETVETGQPVINEIPEQAPDEAPAVEAEQWEEMSERIEVLDQATETVLAGDGLDGGQPSGAAEILDQPAEIVLADDSGERTQPSEAAELPEQAADAAFTGEGEHETVSSGESVEIGGMRIVIDIPPDMLQKAPYLNQEQRVRSAGFLAAQVLRKYPELTSSPSSDPIILWSDIRNVVVARLECCSSEQTAAAV